LYVELAADFLEIFIKEVMACTPPRLGETPLKLRLQGQREEAPVKLRLDILKQSPLSPYYGDPFVNNRW
jgi:hypothetical protein